MRGCWLAAAAGAAALGVLLRLLIPAMKFVALLLVCAGAAALLWGWLESRRQRRWAAVARRVLGAMLVVGVCVFALLEYQVVRYGRTDRTTEPAAVIVLGAGVNGTTPSLSLQVRLQAALDYLADKPDIPVVVTGGQGPGEEITEARCMADWLIARGLDPERILLEEQAVNTQENIRFSKEILADEGIDLTAPVAVVSADYHLYRASLYWGTGMVPVAAEMPAGYLPLTINYYVREAFGVATVILGLDSFLSALKR